MKALITHKLGMTSAIGEDGALTAMTLLSVESNAVTQLKTTEADGYFSVQVGGGVAKKVNKPLAGHVKKAKASPKVIREFRIDELPKDLSVGQKLTADVFEVNDTVNAVALSKGKGFAGTIKRHNFHRQRKTHGGKGNTRKPGSIGSMYPQHILKGKKMAGQMGHARTTVKNLKVALVDPELKVIGVTGAVPGPKKGVVLIREAK